jgi:hypothetical protein
MQHASTANPSTANSSTAQRSTAPILRHIATYTAISDLATAVHALATAALCGPSRILEAEHCISRLLPHERFSKSREVLEPGEYSRHVGHEAGSVLQRRVKNSRGSCFKAIKHIHFTRPTLVERCTIFTLQKCPEVN